MSSRPLAGSPTMPAEEASPAQSSAGAGVSSAAVDELDLGAVGVDGEGQLNAGRDAPVGGQAVLEGVMMRGVSNWAVAVRKPSEEQLAEGERSPEEAALGEI